MRDRKALLEEFKKFAFKGNVLNMAVGVVIGTAFGKITASIVNDIIMPPLGLLIGGIDFRDLKLILREAQGDIPAVAINWGNFIQIITEFMIIAISLFIIVRIINRTGGKINSKRIAAEKEAKEKADAEAKAKAEAEKKPTAEELLTELIEAVKAAKNERGKS